MRSEKRRIYGTLYSLCVSVLSLSAFITSFYFLPPLFIVLKKKKKNFLVFKKKNIKFFLVEIFPKTNDVLLCITLNYRLSKKTSGTKLEGSRI